MTETKTKPEPAKRSASQSDAGDETAPSQPPKRGIPTPIRLIAAVALLAGVGYGGYRLFFYQPEPEGLFLSGRIESYDTDVAAKSGGRVAAVAVEEGDLVKPGQLLVRIDDSDLRAQLQGAIAQVQVAQEQLQRARQQLPVLQAQLLQAQLTTQQVAQDSQGKVLEADNNLAAARAQLVEAQANLKLARIKQRRTQELFAQGAISAQQQDEDNAQVDTNQAQVKARLQQVQAAEGTLTQARASLQNQPIQEAAVLEIERQTAQARTDIAKAEQDVRNARAKQAEIQANLNYLVIKSPMAGSVITRSVEPGEVVASGSPLLTLINLDRLYLRGFVPEGQLGQVKLGQSGRVYLDSFPDQPLEATVTRIDPEASFTPENTYFQKDRVNQVFGVELTLKDPQGQAKPGMPADGRILIETQPQSRRPFAAGLLGP